MNTASLLLFLILLLFLVSSISLEVVASSPPSSYFAMCLIVKRDPHLREWIEYHKRMGCSKFYVFDHNNTKPLRSESSIRKYVDEGLVHITRFTKSYGAYTQMSVYNQCLTRFGTKHQFMAFIDADEYIVVKDSALKIPDVLRRYEEYGGLVLFWRVFGSSGHVRRPRGGVLANYNRCANDYQVKTIANMRYTAGAGSNPHSMAYKEGYFSVDTAGQPCVGPTANATVCNRARSEPVPAHLFDVMYINHYFTKSEEEWKLKLQRGNLDSAKYSMRLFHQIRNSTESQPNCSYLKMPSA